MHKLLLFYTFCLLAIPTSLLGSTFYIDPINGDIGNDGSETSPWSTLQEVIDNNMIESYKNSPLPYDPLANILVVNNPNGIVKGGDTLLLRNGLHGNILIRNYNNLEIITVKNDEGHNNAVLEKLQIQGGRNWKFEGLEISSEPYGNYLNGILVFFESHGFQGPVSHIDISNCRVFSTETPWTEAQDWIDKSSHGIYANGDSINVFNNTVSNVNMGISAKGDYIIAKNNKVINFSGDGMRILGSYILFESNTIKNCYDVDENHDDGIQSFTTTGLVVDNNTIRNNIIINFEDPNQPLRGPLQGIGCFDGWYNNWVIENNLICVDHWHGISLYGANNCRIINNTVLDPTPQVTPGMSWIRIDDHAPGSPSTNCVVKNNVSNNFVVTAETGNNVALTTLDEYAVHFPLYENIDYHLAPSSSLIDAADDLVAPAFDLDFFPRPAGAASDIGCYEYHTTVGVENISSSHMADIKLYPNPVDEELIIDIEGSISWLITNALGQVLLGGTSKKINVSALPSGIYFLKIGSVSKVFVKK